MTYGLSVMITTRKMIVSAASRMFSAISLGVFCRLAPSISPIMRSMNDLAGVGGDADLDLVGEHGGAAGDGRAVAAGFADDRGGFAGDGRFVHRRRAFDDLAVGGDQLVGVDDEQVALAERFGRHDLDRCRPACSLLADGFGAALAQRIGLGLAAALGHRLGEVREEHREPEPQRDLQHEAERLAVRVGEEQLDRRDRRADLGHEHDRVSHHVDRVELLEALDDRREHDLRIEQRPLPGLDALAPSVR